MKKGSTILMSTSYFPSIGYFAHLIDSDKVIIERNETYPKQTYRNRCRILSANGTLDLSIPVYKTYGNNTKTKDIQIINSEKWFIKHWRAISSAYSNSPFFLYYQDDLLELFSSSYENLIDFNTGLTKVLLKQIGIDTNLVYSDTFIKPGSVPMDFRFSFSPKNDDTSIHYKEYTQVFSTKYQFIPNLSIIDLLFNLGPETKEYLKQCTKK